MRLVKYRGKYAIEIWEGGERRRPSLGTDDELEAQRLFEEYKRLKAQEKKKPVSVQECWDAYRASLGTKPAATTMGFEWKSIGPVFGARLATAINGAECKAYTEKRRKLGRSDGTIWTELGRLRQCLVWAEQQKMIDKAPHIERPAPPPPRNKFLTREQANAAVKAADTPHVRMFVVLAITTAGRAGALLDLTWDRVDFERGLVYLHDPERTTTKKGRATVPMNKTLRMHLQTAFAERTDCGYVIEWGGRKVGSVKKGIKAIGRRIGAPWLSPHVFRHTAARFMAERGMPMSEIAQYLGHDNDKQTQKVYARFSPDYLRGSASALELEMDIEENGGRTRDRTSDLPRVKGTLSR